MSNKKRWVVLVDYASDIPTEAAGCGSKKAAEAEAQRLEERQEEAAERWVSYVEECQFRLAAEGLLHSSSLDGDLLRRREAILEEAREVVGCNPSDYREKDMQVRVMPAPVLDV